MLSLTLGHSISTSTLPSNAEMLIIAPSHWPCQSFPFTESSFNLSSVNRKLQPETNILSYFIFMTADMWWGILGRRDKKQMIFYILRHMSLSGKSSFGAGNSSSQ